MEFSLKKYIQNDYYTFILFLFSIMFMGIYILILLFSVVQGLLTNQTLNVTLLIGIAKYMFPMPIISIILFLIFLLKINSVKLFLNDCTEIDATIEKYLAYYGSRNYSHKEGTETAIRVFFIYFIDGIEYKKEYSIAKNRNTIKYFEKYKNQGNNVKILVSNRNSKNILIKEIIE